MRSPSGVLTALAAVALLLTLTGSARAGASASIEQIRNGVGTATTTPTPTWVSGNAGASNSHYLESHSIGYRTVMDNLPTNGTVIELVIGYDLKRSGSYAIDYLTHFQRLMPHVTFGHTQPEVLDPLAGITGVGTTVSTAPIPPPTLNVPVDPDGPGSAPAVPQPGSSASALPAAERLMTLYGGTLLDVTYVQQGDVNLATSSSESRIKVRFTANSSRAVLVWGGHLASRWEWGFNADGSPRSAGGISGSSYHMRLVSWSLGNVGNQDRSLSTDAVIAMPVCGISNAGPLCAGTTNTHSGPSNMQGYQWSLFENSSGASIVSGATSQSVVVNAGTGGSYGLLLVTTENGYTKQCQASVTVNPLPSADAGPDQVVCSATPQAQLAGSVSGGTGAWSGGAGTFAPGSSSPNASYLPTAAEVAAGSVTLTLTCTTAGGLCPPASDQVRISFDRAPTANAGSDITVCAGSPRVQLAGVLGGGAISGVWTGGAGTFSPGASTLNATYDPTPAEIAAGNVTLTLTTLATGGPCAVASDDVRILIQPVARADAGASRTVCASAPAVQLAGAVSGGASSGTWSGGLGTFNPGASSLTATYTPTAAELAAGGVTLTLTTNDPAGPCDAASSTVHITYSPAATADAGADVTVCASSPQVTLAGSVGGGAVTGAWTGGAGTYAPSASSLNASYMPTAAEIAAGSVTLTLTTDAVSGPCAQASDQVTITIRPAATVNAGPDLAACSSSPSVQLAGAVGGGATSGLWSGGGGTFTPGTSALNAVYTPSAAEVTAGSVTLTLTTNDPAGPCGAVSDQVRIAITPAAVVDAGADVVVCASDPRVQLHGVVSGGASGGTWSGGAGSFSPGASALNATYTPTAAEIASGSVALTLTSAAGTGPCPQVSDRMLVFIDAPATVDAGPDQLVCATSSPIQLAGKVGGRAAGGTWSGGVGGTFSPGPSALNATYAPSPADLAAGNVMLTLTTNDPAGPCSQVSDQMTITLDSPQVTVANHIVCTGMSPVTLCATVSRGIGPYTYRWSNGATASCITVADTGSYSVTVMDAKGCQTSGTGRYGQRECIGQLTHTTATCTMFIGGTADPLSDIHWLTSNNVITTISPGVFFYYSRVAAPRTDFTIVVQQIVDDSRFPFCDVQRDQVVVYDQDCGHIATGGQSTPGQATVDVHGARPGQVLVVGVKYSLKTLVGTYMDATMGCHYDFHTLVDGHMVDADPNGFQIGAPRRGSGTDAGGSGGSGEGGSGGGTDGEGIVTGGPHGSGAGGTGGGATGATGSGGDLASQGAGDYGAVDARQLERPVPNPFTNGMRMAYAVANTGERVEISVYDLAGRRMKALVSSVQAPGRHDVAWDGRDENGTHVRRGMYFIHIRIGTRERQVRVAFVN